MESNEKITTIKCPHCGNTIKVQPDTVALFCFRCKSWLKPKNS